MFNMPRIVNDDVPLAACIDTQHFYDQTYVDSYNSISNDASHQIMWYITDSISPSSIFGSITGAIAP